MDLEFAVHTLQLMHGEGLDPRLEHAIAELAEKGLIEAEWREPAWIHGALRNYTDLDPQYPLMPYCKDSSKAIMAKAILTKEGVKRVSFLPMIIDKKYRPEFLHNGDPRFDDVVRYMDWASEDFAHKFTVSGDEVVLTA